MSMPTFPETDLTRGEAINQVISSIAMEELSLSHIINAEGEKLQYILGTIPGSTGPLPTIEQILEVNESIRLVLQAAADNQTILRSKLQTAISSAILYGPPGPEGPQGPATITVDEEVIKLGPDEEPYVLNNGTDQHVELQFAMPVGAPGEAGTDGLAATITIEPTQRIPFDGQPTVTNIGTDTEARLIFGIPQGEPGETGPQGPEGPMGPVAESLTTIPFSIGKQGVALGTDATGNPNLIAFSGFAPAFYNGTFLDENEWESGTITITQNKQVGALFIMPYDATLKKIYTMFANPYEREILYVSALRPFVCLATSNADNMIFTILQDTITFTEPYPSGINPAFNCKKGSSTDLDISIPEGTVVAILAGIYSDDPEMQVNYEFTISGGILFQ